MNPVCPACQAKRRHTEEELKSFHSLARQGCTDGKWSKEELQPKCKPS